MLPSGDWVTLPPTLAQRRAERSREFVAKMREAMTAAGLDRLLATK